MPTFADALQNLLIAKKWNVTELSRRVPVDRVTISRHVNGHVVPTPSTRTHYAVAFGLTLEQLDAMWDEARSAPLPPNPIEEFIVERWQAMGRAGGLEEIAAAGGPSVDEIRTVCRNLTELQRKRSDVANRLARFLSFDGWDDVRAAMHEPKTKGVRWKLGYVRLPDDAYRAAVGAAKERGVSVEEWVGEAVREKVKR